jgi:hypothetical protein
MLLSCGEQDLSENDMEVTGQVARDYGYNFHAYNPLAYNPITGELGGRGKDYTDFCVWFTVKNKGDRDLVFDMVQAYWFFSDGFFESRLTPGEGERFVISPDGSRQFSLSTGMRGDEFVDKYGDSAVNFFFIIAAVTNSQEEIDEWRKNKNPSAEEMAAWREATEIKTFGPFMSSNIPPLNKLPFCDENEVGFGTKGKKYYPLKFFLVDKNFSGKDLDKWRQGH